MTPRSAMRATLPLLAVLCTLAACSYPKAPYDPPLPTLAHPATGAPGAYTMLVGDALSIKFYKNPELNEDVVVRSDGMISLQLVGDVPAAGRTPMELGTDLKQRFSSELQDPSISVIVRKPVADRVYVGGEVGKQGFIDLTGGLTVFQAIQASGGFAKTAHRAQVILIRRTPDGKATGRSIDVRPVQEGIHPEDDVVVVANDVVFVPRSKIANVDNFVDMYIRQVLPISTFPLPTF
ncbi:MAG TPA: polysaccharide biosynthesis/export family protein [Candidatus Binatia bacterium]